MGSSTLDVLHFLVPRTRVAWGLDVQDGRRVDEHESYPLSPSLLSLSGVYFQGECELLLTIRLSDLTGQLRDLTLSLVLSQGGDLGHQRPVRLQQRGVHRDRLLRVCR